MRIISWILTAFVASVAALDNHSQLHKRATYVEQVLQHHNVHRRNHSAPDLKFHYGLAKTAQAIAKTCNFQHAMNFDGGNYGQNIAAGVPAQKVSRVISDLWYNEEVSSYARLYGVANPRFSGAWGHFTQIVWKGTTHVGCYTQKCPEGIQNAPGTYDYTVCNYRGVGNVRGQYARNVGKPRGRATVSGN
ncbi:Putative CAP domain-containing protein [Septoria linicola]|uniref:CAP domain-containing protein n=1 Tax=Septoria linicola TaxID=215465 RepID=A0A9Q9AF87_9PEZI|nr:putative CAP domain-containing protein [Septoria linicola]USW48364.1 Putative CAP domain-containing protein [Septoria linicola]